MIEFLKNLRDIYYNGVDGGNRTATTGRSLFGLTMDFDMRKGFPLLTTKVTPIRVIAEELFWFLTGSTNNNHLKARDVTIWDEWATANGDLGPIYGAQWRAWQPGVNPAKLQALFRKDLSPLQFKDAVRQLIIKAKPIDQIADLINTLKTRPNSRRMLVSAWDPAVLPDETKSPQENVMDGRQSLAACHTVWQMHSEEMSISEIQALYRKREKLEHVCGPNAAPAGTKSVKILEIIHGAAAQTGSPEWKEEVMQQLWVNGFTTRHLSMQLYQRSCDFPLGVPFNIASYALLLTMIGQVVNMEPKFLHWRGGNCHIYHNQMECVKEWMTRGIRDLPRLVLNPAIQRLEDFTINDIKVEGYAPHPKIVFPRAAV
jgi:thymidylate synthase